MTYKVYDPTDDLAAFVKCFWTLEAPKEKHAAKQRIPPDGCMEMIFHHGDNFRQYRPDGSFIIQPKCFVFGQITQPLEIGSAGTTGIFAVRFHPDAFNVFATIPVREMDDRAVPLRELYGDEGEALEQAILATTDTEERIKLAETFLCKMLTTDILIDGIVRSSVALMLELKGKLPISKLSEKLQVNRRQLERKFVETIGLSPKQLSKMVRLQSALKMLLADNNANLTSVAYTNDYCDQSHFIREFKEFTGVSPKEFYSDNLRMAKLFSGAE